MTEIIIGAKVINKLKQVGTIVYVDNTYIGVDFGNRTAKVQLDAFDKGFLKYENTDLQSAIDIVDLGKQLKLEMMSRE